MLCDDILKGINIIWMRLFDHRGFLNGEIQYSLKEFEEKRNDKEVETLFSIVENIAEIKDTQIIKTKDTLSAIYPQIELELGNSLKLCKEIEALERQCKFDETLETNRENRKAEWQQFVDDIAFNCKRVDNTFEEKEEELQEFFRDLERKLLSTNKY